MRTERFLFLSGGSAGGTVLVATVELISRTTAHVRARPRYARCAVPFGLGWGRLGGALRRCAVGIGGGRVVSDALCRWDWPVSGLSGGSVTALCRWD